MLDRRRGAGRRPLASSPPVLRSVVDARATRYLMLNAPEAALDGDLRARPGLARAERAAAGGARDGRRARARPGRRRLARCCPRLEAAGASSILLVPVERMLGMSDVAAIVDDVRARGDAAAARVGAAARRRRAGARACRAATSRRRRCSRSPTASAAGTRRSGPPDVRLEIEPGVELERRWLPLRSVGIYVPRGLVSTLVMCAVPAQVAGVERIVVDDAAGGRRLVAAAAELLGLDEVWALGGPQAIAALAYGTETIPRVDKIVGPGNAFVNEAKLLVSRDVAIDLPAGPSEVVVVAGRGADARVAELELAAQAEHGAGRRSAASSRRTATSRPRSPRSRRSRPSTSCCSARPRALAPRVRNAGAVFVGADSPVAAGDYATGGNHVLPTGGWARAVGGLGLETFLKPVTVQRLTRGRARSACGRWWRRSRRSRACPRTRRRSRR